MKRYTIVSCVFLLMILVAGCKTVSETETSIPDVSVFPTSDDGNVKALVSFRGGSEEKQKSVVLDHKGKLKKRHGLINAVSIEIPSDEIERLRENPLVKIVEPNSQVKASSEIISWGLTRIDGPTVHANGNMGSGVRVAVLDTGVDYTHPDLDGNWAGGYDFINGDNDPMDDSTNGHGTHCSGIICAERGNETGVVGVAPQARLSGVKVLDSSGYGDYSTIIQGLQWCVNNNIQIASMSLGGTVDSQILKEACDAAYAAGVLIIAAAGNAGMGTDTVQYPAKYDSVIAVGSTDSMNLRSSFSSTGPTVEIAAPGSGIYSTLPGNRVGSMSGTSMACPQVSGVAALIIKSGITDPYAVRGLLRVAVKDLGVAGRDEYFGFGLTNANLAVTIEVPVIPVDPITEPPVEDPIVVVRDLSCSGISVGATKVGRATNVIFNVQNLGSETEVSEVQLADENKNIIIDSRSVTLVGGQSSSISMKWTPSYSSPKVVLVASIGIVDGETVISNNSTKKSVKVR